MALACFAIALAVFLRTLAPTVYTFDSAEFATGAFCLGIIHSTGYPLYLLIARAFTYLPIGDIAYRVNLLSAIGGAATVSLLSILCLRVTKSVWISVGSALLYSFSHYFWPEAVIAETYTLNTTLVLCLVLLVTQSDRLFSLRRATLVGLLLGLALANHMSSLLIIPALVYWIVLNCRPEARSSMNLVALGLGVSAGLVFYLYLPIRFAADPPLNYAKAYFDVDLTQLLGIWKWVSGEMFRPYVFGYDITSLPGQVAEYGEWLWVNFLGAGVILGAVGCLDMLRRETRLFAFFGLIYLSYTFFFINYRVVNKDTMFSVSYLVWTVWIAVGARCVQEWLNTNHDSIILQVTQPLRTALIPGAICLLALISLVINYDWADQSHNRQASQFAGQLLDEVLPSAFVFTQWTWATPLEYLQIVEGRRLDVTVFDQGLYSLAIWGQLRDRQVPDSLASEQINARLVEVVGQALKSRPVYATDMDPVLAKHFRFVSQHNYFRLESLP